MPVEFLYGLFQLPFWGYALVVFAMIQLLFLAITLFLHREQSHGALVLHPVLRHGDEAVGCRAPAPPRLRRQRG